MGHKRPANTPQTPSKTWKRHWLNTNMPLAYKFAIKFTLLILFGMGVLSFIILKLQTQLLEEQIQSYGMTVSEQYASTAIDALFTDNNFEADVLSKNLGSNSKILGNALYNQRGLRISQNGIIPNIPTEDIILMSRELSLVSRIFLWTKKSDGTQLASFISNVQLNGVSSGYALVTLSFESIQSSFERTSKLLLFFTLIMAAISIIMAGIISRHIAKPFTRLVSAANKLGCGDYDIHIEERRNDEIGQLINTFNHVADSLRRQERTENLLAQVVAEDVALELLQEHDNDSFINSRSVNASVLFVDIVGFTSMAEKMQPQEVVELLNELFGYFTQCGLLFFGSVDKFIGDNAMIVFGNPKENEHHRFNAMSCGATILKLLERLNTYREQNAQSPIQVRIGINSGEMMAGIVGNKKRVEYTVIGDTVNIASRLCDLAEPGTMVVGEDVLQNTSKGQVSAYWVGDINVKGKTDTVSVYSVSYVSQEYNWSVDYMIDDILASKSQSGLPGRRNTDTRPL